MTFDPDQETAPSPASNHVRQGRSTLWGGGNQIPKGGAVFPNVRNLLSKSTARHHQLNGLALVIFGE